LLEIRRHGFTEESHFTIAYSPVPDDTAPGGIGGVLATVHEITEKVVGERRTAALRDLAARVADAKTAKQACAFSAEVLVRLPVVPEIPDRRQATVKSDSDEDRGLRPPPRRILVVDDNEDSAESMARLLELSGNRVQRPRMGWRLWRQSISSSRTSCCWTSVCQR